jgi:oxygen-independent coproporphyrinogen-3 oxidase
VVPPRTPSPDADAPSVDPDRGRDWGLYVHVPFCQRRCGYCAFSTVAVGERLDTAVADRFLRGIELELAAAHTAVRPERGPAATVYLGGGTPTMLDERQMARLLGAIGDRAPLADDVEITVESNPDGLAPGQLDSLRGAGVNRISFGLQSVEPRVLALLDRTHDPAVALDAVERARAAGFDHVGLDLILGTPGETAADVEHSVLAAIDSGVDHVSAYALSVEPGTKLAARVRAGELPSPSDDDAAARYVRADELLTAAGFTWYELSNWARDAGARSRHNLLYWRDHDWWGLGPSAHSHMAGLRSWNHAGMEPWADALEQGRSPIAGSERPDAEARRLERVMLGIRLREGLALDDVADAEGLQRVVDDGLAQIERDRLVLTLQGRLLADHVVRTLT